MTKSFRAYVALVLVVLLTTSIALGCGSGRNEDEGGAPAAQATAASTEPVSGVTANQVIIGGHVPASGPQAQAAQVHQGMKAHFDAVNRAGGVNGRTIVFESRDDGYSPTTARVVTQELVEERQVFAMVGSLGTPTHLAVVDYLTEQKVPDLFVLSNATALNNPSKYPYTFSALPSGFPEAKAAAQYMNDRFAGAKAGVLYQNDDFGRDYLRGFKEVFKGSIVREQSFELTEQDTSSQTSSLLAADADLLVLACLPVQCASAIRTARGAGSKAQVLLAAPNGSEAIIQIAGGPNNVEGALVPVFSKTVTQTDDPAVQKHVELMKAANLPASGYTIYGAVIAELFVDVLKRAGQNPTRASLLAAAESIDFKSDLALTTGSTSKTNHYVWSGLRFLEARGGKWTPVGDVIQIR